MRLSCAGSSSSGNCWILTDNAGEILLLDVGVSEMEIKKAVDFKVSNIVGACATHSHADHSKSVKDCIKMGIKVATPYSGHIQIQKYCFGRYEIKAFALDDVACEKWQHTNSDGSECPIYGFFVTHPELSSPLIYATDSKLIKWCFAKQHPGTIILGVDYQEDRLSKESYKTTHILQGHMSIDCCCDFLKANKTNSLRNVIIGHLSEDGADEQYFIDRVKEVVSCDIYMGRKGLEINLDDCPF